MAPHIHMSSRLWSICSTWSDNWKTEYIHRDTLLDGPWGYSLWSGPHCHLWLQGVLYLPYSVLKIEQFKYSYTLWEAIECQWWVISSWSVGRVALVLQIWWLPPGPAEVALHRKSSVFQWFDFPIVSTFSPWGWLEYVVGVLANEFLPFSSLHYTVFKPLVGWPFGSILD